MRVPRVPEIAEPPPPPYTPSASTILTPPPSEVAEPASALRTPSETSVDDAGVTNPADYFGTRPFTRGETLQNEGVILGFLTRPLTFLPSTTREALPFPEPIETFFNRDVTFKDWDLFKDHLLPQRATSFASEKATFVLTPAQQEHVRSILAEWNKGFFRPRRISIEAVFEAGPSAPEALDSISDPAAPRRTPRPRAGRSASVSSSASTTSNLSVSSTASSISSVPPSEIESIPPSTIQDWLQTLHATPSSRDNPRLALQTFRSQARAAAAAAAASPPAANEPATKDSPTPLQHRKSLRQDHRDLKREIRALVRAARHQQREERRSLRRIQREDRRATRRSHKTTNPAASSRRNQSFQPPPPPLSSRTTTTASSSSSGQSCRQQRRTPTGLWGSAVDTMNGWAKACEEACDLGEKHAVEVAKRIDGMIEEGERRLRGTTF